MKKHITTIISLMVLGLTACVSSGAQHSRSPVANSPQTSTGVPKSVRRRVNTISGVPITQCFSKGGTEARIKYPVGWFSRVSQAETEDELLGGATHMRTRTEGGVEPVTAVSYNYPSAALSPPIEAICEVKFDVSRSGVPSHAIAACSSSLFVTEAIRAVSAARFKPIRINGGIARGINVVYQMKFCLSDEVHQNSIGIG